MQTKIIFIVGLTGVGKSSTIENLLQLNKKLTLLPNRRTLTDEIIIPYIQDLCGEKRKQITDRALRFALSAEYRKHYPTGMAHVVNIYLQQQPNSEATFVFDNLRGVNEVHGAMQKFPETTRFIMLDAPEQVRLKRLLGRNDSFDQIEIERVLENKVEIEGVSSQALAKATKIIHSERLNYNSKETAEYLKQNLCASRLCYINTSNHDISEVANIIQRWL